MTSITHATYQNLPYNPPNLVSNVVNGADGPVSYTLGNGLNVYLSYDGLGRPNGGWVCTHDLNLSLSNIGASGFSLPGSAAVVLYTSWQRFVLTAART